MIKWYFRDWTLIEQKTWVFIHSILYCSTNIAHFYLEQRKCWRMIFKMNGKDCQNRMIFKQNGKEVYFNLAHDCWLLYLILSMIYFKYEHSRPNKSGKESKFYLKVRMYLMAEAFRTGKALTSGATIRSLMMWLRQNSLKSTNWKTKLLAIILRQGCLILA